MDSGEKIREIDEDVIYVSCIPNHWGHFLLDVVSRLWLALENTSRIAFCISGFSGGKLIANMQEFFALLGYKEQQLIIIDKPTRFHRIILETNWHSEAGEKILEDTFRKNGFKVFSPELLSLKEQILLISGCKEIASLSGTIPHNIIFANKDSRFIILSRTAYPNSLQVMINHMAGIDYTIIDVYHRVKKPNRYGSGPFWVEYNKNLKRYIV